MFLEEKDIATYMGPEYEENSVKIKNKKTAMLLCGFLGALGIHRFYLKKYLSGILYLITFGLFGIGVFFDLIMLGFNKFKLPKDIIVKKDILDQNCPSFMILLFLINIVFSFIISIITIGSGIAISFVAKDYVNTTSNQSIEVLGEEVIPAFEFEVE